MKISQKALDSVISELEGEEVIPLVNFLKTAKNVSEFQISTKIKLPVDIIRNQLYRLYNHNLVSFIRKKDKKKGWYIYYWTLNLKRIKFLVTDLKRKRIEVLKERTEREENTHFFTCSNQCIRVDFEQATNFEYSCPECGELLNQEDNQKMIENIKKEIVQLKKDVEKEDKAILAAETEKASKKEEEPKPAKTKTTKKKTTKKSKSSKKATKKSQKKKKK